MSWPQKISQPFLRRVIPVLLCIASFPVAYVSAQPVIAIDSSKFNFGSVYRDQRVKRIVKIKNAGNADLHIENVASPCGCTTTQLKDEYVHPGDSTQVEMTLNTTTLLGKIEKYIIIVSNDFTNRNLFIYYNVSVVSLLDPTPPFLYLGEIDSGKSAAGAVSFKNVSDRKIHIISVRSRSGMLKYSTLPPTLAPGDSASLRVELSLNEPVVFKDEIRIEIDSKEQSVIRVGVAAKGVRKR